MNDYIKPIETSYKGYRFRSRTEARWAIVFDGMDLKWEYEKEGYDLPGYGWHLPDFYLPKQPSIIVDGLIIEIKGQDAKLIERAKASSLTYLLNLPVIILCGVPGDHSWYLLYTDNRFDSTQYSKESWWTFAGIKVRKSDVQKAYEAARSSRFEFGERK